MLDRAGVNRKRSLPLVPVKHQEERSVNSRGLVLEPIVVAVIQVNPDRVEGVCFTLHPPRSNRKPSPVGALDPGVRQAGAQVRMAPGQTEPNHRNHASLIELNLDRIARELPAETAAVGHRTGKRSGQNQTGNRAHKHCADCDRVRNYRVAHRELDDQNRHGGGGQNQQVRIAPDPRPFRFEFTQAASQKVRQHEQQHHRGSDSHTAGASHHREQRRQRQDNGRRQDHLAPKESGEFLPKVESVAAKNRRIGEELREMDERAEEQDLRRQQARPRNKARIR